MTVKERIKYLNGEGHKTSDRVIFHWGGFYMNGKEMLVGDKIFYAYFFVNDKKDRIEMLSINVNDLDDYKVDEYDDPTKTYPFLELKVPNYESLQKIVKIKTENWVEVRTNRDKYFINE